MSTEFLEHFSAHRTVIDDCLASLEGSVTAASGTICSSLKSGKKILCFGNGGSATQASHMVGELLGRYKAERGPLPGVALVSDPGAVTCIGNDYGYGALFERQVEGLAGKGDVLLGLTTSGRSENVLRALVAGRKVGATTIVLCGRKGLESGDADHVIAVPSEVTAYIQEVHLMVLHTWCIAIDKAFEFRVSKSG